MSPLMFLTCRKAVNRFKELLRSPAQLITVLIIAAFIGFTFYTSIVASPPSSLHRDVRELYAIILALYTLVFVLTAKTGFINGAAVFSMADVNLLFTAPFREKKILSYGLLQQLGKSLAPGLFILYQSGTVNNIYGVHISSLIPILIGYGATVFLGRTLSMIIYSLTCSDDRRVLAGKIILYGITGAFIGILIFNTLKAGEFSPENLVCAAGEKIMYLMPVSGFISLSVQKIISGEYIFALWGGIIFLVLSLALYLAVSKIRKDFYEDVLQAAEVSFSAITSRKEGKIQENAPRNIKLGKTGFTRSHGADAVTEKHRIENRRSRIFILSPTGLVTVAFSVLYCIIASGSIFPLFILNAYTMAMSVNSGRWARELSRPYIYLIPEKPFKKLLCLIKGDLPSLMLESLLCFIPVFLTGQGYISEVIVMAAARFSFGFLFMGINLLIQKILGDTERKLLTVLLYSAFVIIFSLPAIITGITAATFFPLFYNLIFTAVTVINSAVSFMLIYFCRNILAVSENN